MKIGRSISATMFVLFVIWAVFIVSRFFPAMLEYGIVPHSQRGLIGIILAPFLHGSFGHIIANSVPLGVFVFVLFLFYNRIAVPVIVLSIVLGGLLVWLFGRQACHIGASGLIYSLAGFLVTSGIVRKKFWLFLLSVILIFLYGGLIWGVLPSDPRISWEGHLFGAVSGILLAFFFRKTPLSETNRMTSN
ncbi:MAG: rhomboid family intramembrane serine protease [Bacteroidota bacterium]